MKRISILAVAIVAALSLSVPVALADHPLDSRVSILANPDFHGGVFSSDGVQCRGGRTVNIWIDKPGNDQLVTTTTTGPQGLYEKVVKAHPGDYYAQVPRKVLSNGTVCSRARSTDLTIH